MVVKKTIVEKMSYKLLLLPIKSAHMILILIDIPNNTHSAQQRVITSYSLVPACQPIHVLWLSMRMYGFITHSDNMSGKGRNWDVFAFESSQNPEQIK